MRGRPRPRHPPAGPAAVRGRWEAQDAQLQPRAHPPGRRLSSGGQQPKEGFSRYSHDLGTSLPPPGSVAGILSFPALTTKFPKQKVTRMNRWFHVASKGFKRNGKLSRVPSFPRGKSLFTPRRGDVTTGPAPQARGPRSPAGGGARGPPLSLPTPGRPGRGPAAPRADGRTRRPGARAPSPAAPAPARPAAPAQGRPEWAAGPGAPGPEEAAPARPAAAPLARPERRTHPGDAMSAARSRRCRRLRFLRAARLGEGPRAGRPLPAGRSGRAGKGPGRGGPGRPDKGHE